MRIKKLEKLKANLRPGRSYRRADLAPFSKSVDRHLQELVRGGTLKKLRAGIYYCPKQSVFGEVPADDYEAVRTFLKDDRFLLTSPNVYNALGVGTSQLYNKVVVYNHKRHGEFVLGGRTYSFRVKHHFPRRSVTQEFLLVDLVNNILELAEDREQVLARVRERVRLMDAVRLKRAVLEFANIAAKKFFDEVFAHGA
ncbi:hypothetical protein WDW37_04540 [Bdellovibrionota bacterium FG-1]